MNNKKTKLDLFIEGKIRKSLKEIKSKELATRIYSFLDKYAKIAANYDPKYDSEDEKYSSPDAGMLKYCADMISANRIPSRCWSEWGSGGYKPYTSVEGKKEHDEIISLINTIIKTKQI